ncbi:MAG TPA: DUF4190 domain-containing protein [Nocardioides sp.]|uniref:DUF4190 domain-containing protein n=1 Tax=Nocardioides sp. TaxID=35761 RepID=UPI002E2F491E|nr:DUF4190 domain-containing protein [Nocardioides sp.]HEX5090372.1 DUF4190 domain-containing protein [Nocardioides sp.]
MSYDSPPPPPPPPPPYAAAPANHPRATLILVLGILSIPCCGLFTGIPAIILGNTARKEIAASGGTIGGQGLVNAGYICGIIGTVLSVVGIIINIAIRAGS